MAHRNGDAAIEAVFAQCGYDVGQGGMIEEAHHSILCACDDTDADSISVIAYDSLQVMIDELRCWQNVFETADMGLTLP